MAGAAARLKLRLVGLLPAGVSIALVLLSATPLGLPFWSKVVPNFALISVFYWTIFRPELMSGPFVFALGLLVDALTGGPFGLSALTLIVAHWVCLGQRKVFVGKSFMIGWWGFAVVAAIVSLFTWAAVSIYHMNMHSLRAVMVQLGLTVALYPGVAWVFGRIEISLMRDI